MGVKAGLDRDLMVKVLTPSAAGSLQFGRACAAHDAA